ncbi:uncharacterized protein PGTG_13984 [Puccinia graminis f. sp. tritici CRL 75-36-700-3]|uniref:Uncharacterized protein n=1 Tax=Puccinia graminis f. sp. tritici (strain CRL 75-36-700-3 / race SCCL) TaxID=418459 RepID=E3KTI8_PUCGT|nr:uncharacterized protein PGTG_13984 [Puccinia graminis f. sp. tritici CRL 75-36-700-3]EFP87613.2 hypothetical protein PGTG_13984 [Puccinia graminis f. sp. tritici CRL 75-36-700-3]
MRLVDPKDLKAVEPIDHDGYHPAGNSICHTPDGSPMEGAPSYTLTHSPIAVAKNVEQSQGTGVAGQQESPHWISRGKAYESGSSGNLNGETKPEQNQEVGYSGHLDLRPENNQPREPEHPDSHVQELTVEDMPPYVQLIVAFATESLNLFEKVVDLTADMSPSKISRKAALISVPMCLIIFCAVHYLLSLKVGESRIL